MGREYLVKGLENEAVKAYLNYMVDSAVQFGGNRAVAEEEMKNALEFEIKLAEVCNHLYPIRLSFCLKIKKIITKFLVKLDCPSSRGTSKC